MTDAAAISPFASPVLVTGAHGQLGRHVLEAAAARGVAAIGVDIAELDITDAAAVDAVLEQLRPSAIINCAAYTAVDRAEEPSELDLATRVNVEGPRVLAEAAKAHGVHLVHVSTDYVFPGTSAHGYAEHDATGPINVYGHTKLDGEHAIRTVLGETAAIARTAWLFSRQAPNFVQAIAGLAEGREFIEVVDDQRGNPTWAGHLAEALVTLAVERIGGTHHTVDQPEATWFELAQAIVEELGLDCEVRPTTSDKFVRPAARAAVSVLRSTDPETPVMGQWRDGVRASLADRKLAAAQQ
ncbi:MAG: dTDP-4-dehydrorhamnose reductase [Thermoleophilia bacterium]|nr:dTDP-4-dehydrorhamnose reductase [Thermoleophilia bacterium]